MSTVIFIISFIFVIFIVLLVVWFMVRDQIPSPPSSLSRESLSPTLVTPQMSNMVCLKCGSAMEEGFIVEYTHNSSNPNRWFQGGPEREWGVVKLSRKENFWVTTYRCRGCGYLESYAR